MAAPDPFVFLAPADPASAYQNLARVLAARGEHEQAHAAYEKAHAIDPSIVVPAEPESREPPTYGPAAIDAKIAPPISVPAAVIDGAVSLVAATISNTHVDAGDGLAGMAPDQLGAVRANFAATGGDSAMGLSARLQNWPDAIRLLPASMATGLFAPYPWDVIRPRGITGQFRTFAVSESVVTFLLLPSLVLGLTRLRRADELFVAAAALGGLLAVSLVITNLGTLFRLRVAFTLLLMAFASYGFDVYGWASSMLRSSRPATARLNGERG
jgi:tetratricopeptide (TPR) repeat protein